MERGSSVAGDRGQSFMFDTATRGLGVVALRYQLQTTIHAILVHVHPAVRMFFVAAFLGENVRVYRFATVRAVADWGIGTSVIHVWTPIPSHCDTLRSH